MKHPEIAKKWSDKYGSSVSEGLKKAAGKRIKAKQHPVGKKKGR
ncbi:MAG: hypothetical protein ABWY25_09385 [Paenisporosarcina sp.]